MNVYLTNLPGVQLWHTAQVLVVVDTTAARLRFTDNLCVINRTSYIILSSIIVFLSILSTLCCVGRPKPYDGVQATILTGLCVFTML